LLVPGVCAGDRATKCSGSHTKKYQVVVAAAALAIRLTLKMMARARPGVERALTTALGSGSTL
jgi:hypothetical protein